MLSFDDMKKMHTTVNTVGQQIKQMSDDIMQETFENDVQTRQCYIYDYDHDDQPNKEYGYDPSKSKTKIPVLLKFIVKSYRTIAKDEPDYHILFEPDVWNSMSCKPDWFIQNYESQGVEFPCGLYVDVPDDRGIYHKWICMYFEPANQFPKIGILKCNYRFSWIEKDGIYRYKRKVWGVNVTQNSYTSGVWRDYKTQSYDDQDKFYLPWNMITAELEHDRRMVISMLRKKPWTYIITKVDDTAPKGVIIFTVKQDKFEPEHDYVSLDPLSDDYGDMFADYFESDVLPSDQNKNVYSLSIEAVNNNVKIGASKVLTARIYDSENNDISDTYSNSTYTWNFEILNSNHDVNELITIDNNYCNKNKNKCKFKFNGDETYIDKNIKVLCSVEGMEGQALLDIVHL